MVRCQVIQKLQALGEQVLYFYCDRNEDQRRDPTKILQAMVKQLAMALPEEIVAEYEERKKEGFSAGALRFQECQTILLSLLGKNSQTTIVIDALDETDPHKRGDLLEALKVIMGSAASLVKVFISSRNDIDIALVLEGLPNIWIDSTDNQGDIERFIRREITGSIERKKILHGAVKGELQELIISTLQAKANGMYVLFPS
jgi:hypothetical protein